MGPDTTSFSSDLTNYLERPRPEHANDVRATGGGIGGGEGFDGVLFSCPPIRPSSPWPIFIRSAICPSAVGGPVSSLPGQLALKIPYRAESIALTRKTQDPSNQGYQYPPPARNDGDQHQ